MLFFSAANTSLMVFLVDACVKSLLLLARSKVKETLLFRDARSETKCLQISFLFFFFHVTHIININTRSLSAQRALINDMLYQCRHRTDHRALYFQIAFNARAREMIEIMYISGIFVGRQQLRSCLTVCFSLRDQG